MEGVSMDDELALLAVCALVRERLAAGFFDQQNQAQAYFRCALREHRYLQPFVRLYKARGEEVDWDGLLSSHRYFWFFNGVDGPLDEVCWTQVQALIQEALRASRRRDSWVRWGMRGLQVAQAGLAMLPWLWVSEGVAVSLLASLFGIVGVVVVELSFQSVDSPRGDPDCFWIYAPALGGVMVSQALWLLWPGIILLSCMLALCLALTLFSLYLNALGEAL